MAASSAVAWAVHCVRCDVWLVGHDHVEFLRENDRSIHLGLRRELFDDSQETTDATERTLRSKASPTAIAFTKLPQTNAAKLARTPFTLPCPACQTKIGSEFEQPGWARSEYLFDAKACRVLVQTADASERLESKKHARLLRSLEEKKADFTIRNPMSTGQSSAESDCEDGTRLVRVSTKRVKTRPKPAAAMVWPTAETIREHFSVTSQQTSLSKLRDYQVELAIGALLENTIIYLPTGCGKTLVAVKVISIFKHLNPSRKAVFLVPTGPLVSQQASYLRRESALTVVELSGQNTAATSQKKRREKVARADALVATPQFFENMLSDGEVALHQICVLVFDEAHHGTGDSPYCDVLKRVATIKQENRPRVVGLTASPFGQQVKVLSTAANTRLQGLRIVYNAKIDTPTISESSRQLSSAFKQVRFVAVEQTPQARQLRQGIIRHMCDTNNILSALMGDGSVPHWDGSLLRDDPHLDHSDWNEQIYIQCGKLRKLQARFRAADPSDGGACEDIGSVLIHMRRILMVLPRMSIHHPLGLAELLHKYFVRIQLTEPRLFSWLKPLYDAHFGPLLNGLLDSAGDGQWHNAVSAQVQAIADVVTSAGFDRNSRAIVFVRRRKTAVWLAEAMEKVQILKQLNPTRFIGHNSYEGMTWEEEQRPTLERFRQGRIRMLVATSVLEEGLDVPECSLVIRFDSVVGMTSLVQSRGRARQTEGQFVVMCNATKQKQLESMIQTEVTMLELARVEAGLMESKAVTRLLMEEMSTNQAFEPEHEPASSVSAIRDQPPVDWSRMDSMLCIMFGTMDPDSHQQTESKQRAHLVLQAITDCGCVNINQADTHLGLVALEPAKAQAGDDDHWELFDELCKRTTFRTIGSDEKNDMSTAASFWIKIVPPVLQTSAYTIPYCNGVPVEDPRQVEYLQCISIRRGRFIRRDTFVQLQEYWDGNSDTRLVKRANVLAVHEGNNQRYDFDLLSVDQSTMWVDMKSPTEAVLYLTFRHAPKIWWTKNSTRDCHDFHLKALTFSFTVRSSSPSALRHLRIQLAQDGLEVRHTKVTAVDAPEQPPPLLSISDSPMVSYAWLALVSSWSFALDGQVPPRIEQIVHKLGNDDLRVQAMIQFEAKATVEDELVGEFRSFVRNQYHALKDLAKLRQRLVLKVIVTPSRIIFERPELAPPNRVFRHFDSENFMYVYFRDENRERMDFEDAALAGRVREVMHNGICVGSAQFKFLGCSLSQLRSANCIFTVLDPSQVREWMGELDKITPPAKYLKRLGQAFTSTRESILIHPCVLLTPAKDIKDITRKYEFTDGCGEISRDAAAKVAHMLRMHPMPSAFQIRLGGAKGVLVVSDGIPSHSTSRSVARDLKYVPEDGHRGVRLRESMVKFASQHHKLEIVAYAGPHSVAYLSRQSVLILSDLGIHDAVFMGLQDEFMVSLSAMLVTDHLGLQEVRGSLPPDQIWWMDVLYNTLSGDQLKLDLYHRRIVHAIYQYKLANTVFRARIPVAKGRMLMGVADFTGTLDHGEVFVQYTERDPSGDNDLDRLVVLSDIDVLVHRNPCHHPGDLRLLRCRGVTDVPQALSQLRDCIVFPTRGPRPHPDECTGGDLDGDMYTVIWDERLLPPRENIMAAMTPFEDTAQAQDEEPVTLSRLIEFYLFALRHDILGMASNAHIAVSDNSQDGCFDSDALVLADICSREVDCCKNPVFLKAVQELIPHQYPDFMQNKEKPSYKSQKVLGKMYRRALALLQHTAPNFGDVEAGEVDESFLTDGYLKFIQMARVFYEQYKYSVRMVLKACGAVSDAELATGMIIEMPSEYKADYFRYGERSRDVFYTIQQTFRAQFDKGYAAKPESLRRRVAAAWYAVAYKDKSDDRLLSFPWILADLLMANKNSRSDCRATCYRPLDGANTSAALELVTSKLQLSILNEIEKQFGALLAAYHERMHAVTSLRLALSPHFDDQDVGYVVFGSSALLTFEPESDLDVVLKQITTLDQLKALARFAETAECISRVHLRERTYVPVLTLSLDEVWSVEISSSQNGPAKTAWFRAYMVEYVFFWPTAYFLIKWGKATGLIRRRSVDGSSSGRSIFLPIGLLWLFVEFCIKSGFVAPLECPSEPVHPTDAEIETSFWSALIQRTLQASQEPSSARVLLAFFRYFGDIQTPQSAFGFTDPLDERNNTKLTAEHTEIFREQCYVAHHQLVVSNGDLMSLLHHQQDHHRRITLSRALSKRVHLSPDFFAVKIVRESGVANGRAKLVFAHHPNALRPDLYVADVVGDGESVHRIEQKIEKIEEQLGAPQLRRPTESIHRSGCCLLLFEGATQQSEQLGFQRYFDARHAHHETLELHQAHLMAFSNGGQWLEHAIGAFTTKFLRQMVKLTHFEKLNPGVARAKAIVRFGHHYLINLPWSFHEESISLATIEMLEREFERGREARDLYESVLVARKRERQSREMNRNDGDDDEDNAYDGGGRRVPDTHDETSGGGGGGGGSRDAATAPSGDHGGTEDSDMDSARARRQPLALDKASAMTTRDRGVAHSFYPMIAPELAPHLHEFAASRKQMRVVAQSESYQVSIVRDAFEFNVRLTPELQLVKVKTRASRWLSATLKMRQEQVEDRSRMDSTPDVRLYVSGSEDVPSSDPVPQMLERACAGAGHGHGVLQFVDDAAISPRRVRVSRELLDQGIALAEVVNVRHMQCTTYQSPRDGVQLRVLTVVEFAVAKPEGFVSETRKTECELVMPPLTAAVRVDAAFARRFLLAGVELVEFLREHVRQEDL